MVPADQIGSFGLSSLGAISAVFRRQSACTLRYLHLMQRCAGDSSGAARAVRRDRFPSTIVNLSVR